MLGFSNKFKKQFSSITKKSGEMVELTKLKRNLSGMQKQRDEKYIELGKAAYEAYSEDNLDELHVDETCREIAELDSEIEKLEAEIEDYQLKEDTCPECGAQVEPGAEFCSSCGHALRETTVCPACGEKIEPGAKFCPSCGEKLEAKYNPETE